MPRTRSSQPPPCTARPPGAPVRTAHAQDRRRLESDVEPLHQLLLGRVQRADIHDPIALVQLLRFELRPHYRRIAVQLAAMAVHAPLAERAEQIHVVRTLSNGRSSEAHAVQDGHKLRTRCRRHARHAQCKLRRRC